ncbi:MAG: ABC transporter substrate-binding protein [Hyphomicrobiaceae bacterium]|nr:ABC transporter substrate-binding protein [Hyphomicrobiaceae bacterium]
MSLNRRQALLSGSALVGAGLIPSVGLAQAKAASLAFGPATPIYALGMIAEEKGFFKTENLDFKFVMGNAGTHGRQSLAAGQALFAHGDASHPLQLSTRGKKAKIIMASQVISSIANIVVRKDLFDAGINSIEKLGNYKRPDGSKPVIAATAIGSGTWMYGTYAMETAGFGDKINWVAGGGLKTMLPGLETKQFDAIIAVPSWVVEAEAKGFGKAVFNTSIPGTFEKAFGGTVPVLVIYTLEETIQNDKAMVQSFVNGMYQAMKWVKATPLDDVYALVAKKYFDGVDPVAVKAELGFDKATSVYDGRVDKAMWERGGKVWYRAGSDIPPTKFEDIVDMSFVDAAQAKFK